MSFRPHSPETKPIDLRPIEYNGRIIKAAKNARESILAAFSDETRPRAFLLVSRTILFLFQHEFKMAMRVGENEQKRREHEQEG